MPQAAAYGQYPGFGNYPAFPGATGAPGAGGGASSGMPQPASGSTPGLGLNVAPGQPGADLSGGAAGQAQWSTADPNYYSNYWGGKKFVISAYRDQ